ncbi:MAG: hypothetical protein NVSMB19_11870 [Vulcanimicrobiaceae bacterium]
MYAGAAVSPGLFASQKARVRAISVSLRFIVSAPLRSAIVSAPLRSAIVSAPLRSAIVSAPLRDASSYVFETR